MGDGGHHVEHRNEIPISGVVVASFGPHESFGAGTVLAKTADAWWKEPSVWCGAANSG